MLTRTERTIPTWENEKIRMDRDGTVLAIWVKRANGTLQAVVSLDEAKALREMLGQVLNEPTLVLAGSLPVVGES